MSDKVFCKKLRRELPGLLEPPLAGKLGLEILQHTSAEAWAAWQEAQIIFINEHRLDLSERADRQRLTGALRDFLLLDGDADSPPLLQLGARKRSAKRDAADNKE